MTHNQAALTAFLSGDIRAGTVVQKDLWLRDDALLGDFRQGLSKPNTHSDYLLVLYTLACHLPSEWVALEIGVHTARSTRMLLAAADVGAGRVVSCDINAECLHAVPRTTWRRWHFYQGSSSDLGKFWEQPLDLLYIDGGTTFQALYHDWALFQGYVKPGGYIMFRGYYNPKSGMKELYENELATLGSNYEVCIIPIGQGVVLVRKHKT